MTQYKNVTVTVTMTMMQASYSSLKVEKDAYIMHIQSLPYRVITCADGYTFAYGGVHAYEQCDDHGHKNAIKKLFYGDYSRVMNQYNAWSSCPDCGHQKGALCHRLPKSFGGTPCVNNIDYACAKCNGIESNQILDESVAEFLSSEKVTFSYTKKVKVR
jgi:hypothetical protein